MEKENTEIKKTTLKKKKEGYGYKYTDLAEINKYCDDNNIIYYQEIETSELNGEDYIVTWVKDGADDFIKHKGCKIVNATLQGIKNPVQEYGSSLTYCRRYSLLMALGLATEDDDGASLKGAVEEEKCSEAQIEYIKKLVDDIPTMLNYYKIEKIENLTKKQATDIIKRKTKK